jgi:hypothetical protein
MGGNLNTIIPITVEKDKESTTRAKKGSYSQKGKEPKLVADSESVSRPQPSTAHATSKLALFTFFSAFQKHLSSKPAADGFPANRRVICVDPGWTRTPGMRRYITGGSLFGLFLYLLTYPIWWLILKSPEQGAQSFLFAAMDAQFSRGNSTESTLVKECRVVRPLRQEVTNEDVQKRLWEETDTIIQALEKRSAVKRAQDKEAKKKENDSKENDSKENDSKENESKENAQAVTQRQPGSRKSKKAKTSKP